MTCWFFILLPICFSYKGTINTNEQHGNGIGYLPAEPQERPTEAQSPKTDEEDNNLHMDSLKASLPPRRRGLSRYYSGKSRSFTCMADVHVLEDLKKSENPEGKKYLENQAFLESQAQLCPPAPCQRVSSTTHFAAPCVV